MAGQTPYRAHWQNLASYQSHFEAGDAASITVFSADARHVDAALTDQQAREALRILVTDPAVLVDLLERHLPAAIAAARRENPAG